MEASDSPVLPEPLLRLRREVATTRRLVLVAAIGVVVLVAQSFAPAPSARSTAARNDASTALGTWTDEQLDGCSSLDNIRLVLLHTPAPECQSIPWMLPRIYEDDSLAALAIVKNAKTYVEWGSGGSSNTLAIVAQKSLTIENGVEWCETVQQHPVVQRNVARGKHRVLCIDTGLATTEWGHVFCKRDGDDESCAHKFYIYVNAIEAINVPRVDVVFVDGRFRLACATRALALMDESSHALVHDYQRYRDRLREFFVEEAVIGELGVLRPKSEFVGDQSVFHRFMKNSFER